MSWELFCGSLGSHTDDAIEKQHTSKGNYLTLLLQKEFLVDHIICWKLDLAPQGLTAALLPSNLSLSECSSHCRIPGRPWLLSFTTSTYEPPHSGPLAALMGYKRANTEQMIEPKGSDSAKPFSGFTVLFPHLS